MKLSAIISGTIDLFYIPPFTSLMPRQTFRYAACGGMNMALDLVLYFIVFHYVLGESDLVIWPAGAARGFELSVISPHIAALGIVFPITFFNGFWLNRHVAFPGSPIPQGRQLTRYMLSVAGSLAINYVCMKLFVDAIGIFPTPSKALTTCVTIAYSYMAQKFFTFRGSPRY